MAVLEYTLSAGEATLAEVRASSGRIALPEELDGYPLTHLGAYCLSARRVEPSQPVFETTVGEPDPFGRADQPVYGGALIALSLPKTVQELGSHCCYGCTHLEELSFYDGLEYVSDGAFKNCRSLSRITLYAPKGSTAALEGVLSQISGFCEVEIRFPQQTVPLIFPVTARSGRKTAPPGFFPWTLTAPAISTASAFPSGGWIGSGTTACFPLPPTMKPWMCFCLWCGGG